MLFFMYNKFIIKSYTEKCVNLQNSHIVLYNDINLSFYWKYNVYSSILRGKTKLKASNFSRA